MIVVDTTLKYKIQGTEISLFNSETAYGFHTCAEVKDEYYYLGDVSLLIETAVNCWQYINGRMLSSEELHEIMVENEFLPSESV